MVQRKRDELELVPMRFEIQTKNQEFLKALSLATRRPMAAYVDSLIDEKREKHLKFVQRKGIIL